MNPPPPPLYLALIGDLVASRALAGREELQERLLGWAEELSRRCGPGVLATPLVLTAGDEVQALVRAAGAPEIVLLVQELTDRLFGAAAPAIAFGVGLGTLSTGEVPAPPRQAKSPALLDGPCFQLAREALGATGQRIWVRFRGFGEPATEALNALFGLMGEIRAGWTAKQGVTAYGVRHAPSQKAWAEELRVSPSVVSESLKAAHFEALLAGESAARALLAAAAEERR